MGVIFHQGDGWYVYEAIGPVKSTRLERWIARGEGQHYTIKRLKDEKILTGKALGQLKTAALRFMGRPDHPYFEWSDDKIDCSEFVWKIYKDGIGIELGRLQSSEDFDLLFCC